MSADPEFANKAEADEEDDIAKCLRCFKCFPGPLEGEELADITKLFGCTVNPASI